jgi:hypothetical protein
MQIRALVVSTQIRHRAIVCGQFLGEGQYFLSSPREAHRNLNARRSAKSPGGRPRVGPPRSARLRGEDLTDASKGIGASIARTLVVTYASSREGADRVVAEIAGAGSNANRRRSQRLRSRRREAAVRGDQKGVRLARRAGEQRQRLQISALRSNHRRGETLASSFLRVGAGGQRLGPMGLLGNRSTYPPSPSQRIGVCL